jgi:phospholipid/cholesterol/gamma-HCH transport system permease protein
VSSLANEKTVAPLGWVGGVGHEALGLVRRVANATCFLGRSLLALADLPFRWRALLEQVHFLGNRSVVIVVLTSAFTGLVLTLQGHTALARFGAAQMVGALVALSLVRELAPVLAALMIAARAGSAIAATLANMRITEQIDALETMAIDPVSYGVAPSFGASVLVVPPLTALFSVTGLFVARLFAVGALGLDAAQFEASVRNALEWSDVSEGLIKSLAFAVLIAWIATYRGYHASGGARGVGQATTRAVVETSVLILGVDFVLTALAF